MGDLREGSNMQADLYFVHASWTVSSRNGISYNGNKYFKGNLRAIEYTFLLSALNLCTPMQGLCIVIFLQANALNCPSLSLRNVPSLCNLEKQKCHNNCETIQRKNATFANLTSFTQKDQR